MFLKLKIQCLDWVGVVQDRLSKVIFLKKKRTWRNDFSSLSNVAWQKKIFVAHFTLAFTLRIGYTYRKVRKNEFLAKAKTLTKVAANASRSKNFEYFDTWKCWADQGWTASWVLFQDFRGLWSPSIDLVMHLELLKRTKPHSFLIGRKSSIWIFTLNCHNFFSQKISNSKVYFCVWKNRQTEVNKLFSHFVTCRYFAIRNLFRHPVARFARNVV